MYGCNVCIRLEHKSLFIRVRNVSNKHCRENELTFYIHHTFSMNLTVFNINQDS
jgi:hypothetical protein